MIRKLTKTKIKVIL